MARTPKPWYRKDRRTWFVTIDGTRHNLGPDKKAALQAYHRLMDQPRRPILRSTSAVALIDAFLDWCQKHRAPDTFEWYRYRLQRFATTYPDLDTSEIRPYHVQQWLDQLADLSSGSKRNHCRAIKRTLRWALQQGYIDHNPIALMEQPKAGKREMVVTPEEYDQLLGLVSDRCFRDLLITTWETGCRPQESLRVEARHVDLTNSRWVFPESEGKGDALRIVYLTDEALAITKRLMLQHPTGRLFRNSTGRPWTTDAVNNVFVQIQIKLGKVVTRERGLKVHDHEIIKFTKTLATHRMVMSFPKIRVPLPGARRNHEDS